MNCCQQQNARKKDIQIGGRGDVFGLKHGIATALDPVGPSFQDKNKDKTTIFWLKFKHFGPRQVDQNARNLCWRGGNRPPWGVCLQVGPDPPGSWGVNLTTPTWPKEGGRPGQEMWDHTCNMGDSEGLASVGIWLFQASLIGVPNLFGRQVDQKKKELSF